MAPINSGMIVVAIFVSLGGIGIMAMAIRVITMLRRRQKTLDAQDTLPRPFEIIVPAATATGPSTITHDQTFVPMLHICPSMVCSQDEGKGRYEPRKDETVARNRPRRAGSASVSTSHAPPLPQPSSSREPRMQHSMSNISHRIGSSSHPAPPRSWTDHDAQVPRGLPSHVRPGSSSPSLPTITTQPQRAAGPPMDRFASRREQCAAKRALWLSRSASELYRATSVVRYRVPERAGSHGRCYDSYGLRRVDPYARPTNHLRHWHSASPVVHVHHVCSCSEREDVGGVVFQHQDAGVVREVPPPYHKLVKSGVV